MKNTWQRVTRKFPCEICNHGDWCTRSDDGAACCMRVESAKPMANGGWLHLPGGNIPKPLPPRPAPAPAPEINAEALWKRWLMATNEFWLTVAAEALGVELAAMRCLGAAWAAEHNAWAFPMRDGSAQIVGIRLRNAEGQKWAVKGSRQGIFVPNAPTQDMVLVCEGPTDTAAALSMGWYAVGRPSCSCGGPQIAQLCRARGIRRAVVVADNDDPGMRGAERVAGEIGVPACVIVPPAGKDVREFYRMGGTRQILESQLKNSMWRTY